MTTNNKLADALRIAMEWNWLDDDARPSRVAEICDDALAEHDAKAADYVLVPRVPTEAMFDAGVERHRPQNMSAARLRLIWDAMLSAAPGQPPANGDAMTDERALELLRWLTNGSYATPPPPDVTLQQAYDHIAARLQAQQPGAQAVAPYAYEFEQLMFDSMGGWERRIERRLPAKHDDPSRVRDIKPLYLGHPPSIPEPTAEHWRRAIKERGIENPKALDWIEQRARQIAKAGGDRG